MKIKKIWDLIVLIFLILEALLVVIFFVPSFFNIEPYVVISGSMEPKYKEGSLIYVKEADVDSLEKGDTITFYLDNGKTIATHEIYEVNRNEKKIITYGINNLDVNGNLIKDIIPVNYVNVIGKPILCIPFLGYINRYVTTEPGIYVVLFLTLFIIVISFLLEFKNKVEAKNE